MLRSTVRPVISFALTGTLCAIALMWASDTGQYAEVFERVGLLAGPILGFWFRDRVRNESP